MMNDVIEMPEAETRVPAQIQRSASVATTTPSDLLRLAVEQGADMERLEKLMALQERWEANQARKEFNEAKAAFKSEYIFISKDKKNGQYGSMYTTLGNLVNTVTPFLGRHGLSTEWDQSQENGKVTVTCTLSHKSGHSKSSSFEVPPDKSGAKNAIQELKSAITYARAITFEAVCGLASSDANFDDDGNGAGSKQNEKTVARSIITGKAFDKALASIRKGDYSAAEIEKYYDLTPDQKIAVADVEKEKK